MIHNAAEKNCFLSGMKLWRVRKAPGLAMLEVLIAPFHFLAFHLLSFQLCELFYFDVLNTSLLKIKCAWVLWSASWHGSFFLQNGCALIIDTIIKLPLGSHL